VWPGILRLVQVIAGLAAANLIPGRPPLTASSALPGRSDNKIGQQNGRKIKRLRRFETGLLILRVACRRYHRVIVLGMMAEQPMRCIVNGSAGLASTSGAPGGRPGRVATGGSGMRSSDPFSAPVVRSLSVRVVVDSVFDQFMPKATHPFVAIEHVGRIRSNLNSTLAGEWGLSLHLASKSAAATGHYLLDFGYTPEVLIRNFTLLGIEPERLDGLILSHGHRDHYGGLAGFVAHYRDRMRADLRLFAGGKETFREKWVGAREEEPASWGALDQAALAAARVETVCCDQAHALAGPFTTGNIARQSFETVLPNTLVEPTPADHFTDAERRGRLVPDKHPDEHATCYVVEGRGLVVISSCSHCGIINAIRTAMAVSGVDKLHAVLGGFHLGVAPPDYVEHTIAELKALRPDVVIPMHCTGRAFIARMRAEMPGQLVDWNTGSRFTFGV
jgi:7,8-dihydropterin-6-yl-methyl-4-(beta-D-ribofuranosyl)aminobenzene 5'-phosphate synthase